MFYWRTKRRVGELLRKKRIEIGASQEYISFEISIDRMGLSLLENGKANPTLYILHKLCGALNIKLWRLLREVDV